MPKDQPIRNPKLSPAGLPPEEWTRHPPTEAPRRPGGPPAGRTAEDHCRFVSSHGGVMHCRRKPSVAGFCRFHYACLSRGEISPLGRILDVVKDQNRRREINLYGMDLPRWDRVAADPVTGDPSERRDSGS